MSERITRQHVDTRVGNVNRRMESRGSIYRYAAQQRNGYMGLDRITCADDNDWSVIQSTITVGTKREVAEFLHAMMVALDDAATVA